MQRGAEHDLSGRQHPNGSTAPGNSPAAGDVLPDDDSIPMAEPYLDDEMIVGLSQAQLLALTEPQRRDLVRRIEATLEHQYPHPRVVLINRRIRMVLMVGGAIAMIPWITYLGLTLPDDYQANNWPLAWIAFDCLLVLMMAATAYLGWRRRQLVMLPAFGTGVLLLVDAWFDVVFAQPGEDLTVSLLTALLAEVPLAVVQLTGAVMLFRYMIVANPLHDPNRSPWRFKMPF
ncbi:hypothetical protein [Nocardia stercoris]|uniref:Uncharacterized protein n=1 Tax=Nocardia stercoris TaxID=2483361 RepID=A0A3M2L437_9NOCA|nr:hypothetical protein [Nocardia stercoris]RMI32321.1 hypothetical protein EBN03_15210 [Nocardia stercoris]